MNKEIKQVIVIRRDLKMRRGKECAQAAHASMLFLLSNAKIIRQPHYGERQVLHQPLWPEEVEWVENAFTKVCLRVDSEEELLDIYDKARNAGLTVHVVRDNGKTEFHGKKTYTCLAIGPAEATEIDKITGHLRLL